MSLRWRNASFGRATARRARRSPGGEHAGACASIARRCCGLAFRRAAPTRRAIRTRTIKVIVPFVPGSPVDAARARHRAAPADPARPERRHREPAGRRHHDRRQGGGDRAAGRLYAAVHRPKPRLLPGAFPNLDFDPVKSLAPVATVVTWSHVHRGGARVPANTVAELVAYAKANPGKLAFGYGLATMPHILGETFRQATGIDIVSVPYRGGEQARGRSAGRPHPHQRRAGAATDAVHPAKARCGRSPTPGRSEARTCPTCRP